MFESLLRFFKKGSKKETLSESSKDTAKERLHLVLMQDRANVSADFLDLMRQEIIEVIKKYIDIDESTMDVRLTNQTNDDGTQGAPALYANIPILNIKDENKKMKKEEEMNRESQEREKTKEDLELDEVKKEEEDKKIEEAKKIVEEENNEKTENQNEEEKIKRTEIQNEEEKIERTEIQNENVKSEKVESENKEEKDPSKKDSKESNESKKSKKKKIKESENE